MFISMASDAIKVPVEDFSTPEGIVSMGVGGYLNKDYGREFFQWLIVLFI